ncbi:MAG: lipoyl(octanoyl) transferase LipB, partial [Microcoleaceae cyanobacterium]
DLPDLLILLEHPPVYTLGQGATLDNLKFNPNNSDYELHRIERGGEVTYHGPGQLVGYPILNLHRHQTDLHWYLRQLETVLLETLAFYNIQGDRYAGLTGVWVNDKKLGAIGIKVSKWITMHGFSFNVCPDLQAFHAIIPCGIADKSVGSLAEFIPNVNMTEVRSIVAQAFAQVFQVNLISIDPSDITMLNDCQFFKTLIANSTPPTTEKI